MEVTKISSKGQVVLPRGMREELELKEGAVLAAVRRENMIVLKKIENPLLEEDIITLKKVEEAWEDIEKGRFEKRSSEDFLKEIKTW